jgi:hypothetical protein
MNMMLAVILAGTMVGCTTTHYRSNNTVPVSFSGNPEHRKEVSISGKRDFYFWGLSPDQHEVFIDEEVRKAGFDGISKVIIYEQKNPQEMLISFLTFGLYLPRAFTITGFTSGRMLPDDLEDPAPSQFQD